MIELAQALWLLVAALGLALSVSYAGLPMLGQGAFVAVGGVGTALLGPGGAGLALPLACALSVLLAGGIGNLIARGASRVEGAYLALASWGLAWLVFRALVAFPELSGGEQGLVRPSPARLVSPALGLSVTLTPAIHVGLAAALCLAGLLGLRRLDRGPAGLDLAALREGPALAAGLGIPVAARRRTVLTVTAALGGLSGAGTAVLLGVVAPDDLSPLLSLQLFVAVLLGGTARWWGPALGVAVLSALPPLADVLAAGAGVAPERTRGVLTAVLLAAVLVVRALLAQPLRRRRAGGAEPLLIDQGLVQAGLVQAARPDPPSSDGAPGSGPVLLAAEEVHVSYGAVQALSGAGVELRSGQVHALIGPNGSGKSTLLAVLSGDVVPDRGRVEIAGVLQRSNAGPGERVSAGVVRTPQHTVLLPAATARRQVAVGARGGSQSAGAVIRHLLATPSSPQHARDRDQTVSAALALTELSAIADQAPGTLSVGDQRLLQIARAIATGAKVLLLDEPAAGMSAGERTGLARVLRSLAGNGCAVLLVEHDMRLVTAVADRLTVLDGGRVLASGAPADVRADPAVRAAYLGPLE